MNEPICTPGRHVGDDAGGRCSACNEGLAPRDLLRVGALLMVISIALVLAILAPLASLVPPRLSGATYGSGYGSRGMTRAIPEAYCEWCVARMRVSQGLRRDHETQAVYTAIHARECGVVSAPRKVA